jgi:hypothetical protein
LKQKKWVTGVAAAILVVMLLAGYLAVAAELGSKNDPLVTLGYITDELQPYILSQVQEVINEKSQELSGQLEEQTQQYMQKLDDKIASVGAGSAGASDEAFVNAVADAVIAKMGNQQQNSGVSTGYKKVEVPAGKTVSGKIGTEILLRLGGASCVASGDTGLIDLTGGGTLSNGKALVPNHLYIVTIDGRGFKTGSNATLFIRGDYTVG